VRDSNEASWTQLLEVIEFISDATTVPLLFDAAEESGMEVDSFEALKKAQHLFQSGN